MRKGSRRHSRNLIFRWRRAKVERYHERCAYILAIYHHLQNLVNTDLSCKYQGADHLESQSGSGQEKGCTVGPREVGSPQ